MNNPYRDLSPYTPYGDRNSDYGKKNSDYSEYDSSDYSEKNSGYSEEDSDYSEEDSDYSEERSDYSEERSDYSDSYGGTAKTEAEGYYMNQMPEGDRKGEGEDTQAGVDGGGPLIVPQSEHGADVVKFVSGVLFNYSFLKVLGFFFSGVIV